jgi:hypothetical protein
MSAASIMTRVRVPDFDTWKEMFDQDSPRARELATGYRLYRGIEDGNEVYVHVDFKSVDDAKAARERLLASGVLDRFPDHTGPTIIQKADEHTR